MKASHRDVQRDSRKEELPSGQVFLGCQMLLEQKHNLATYTQDHVADVVKEEDCSHKKVGSCLGASS